MIWIVLIAVLSAGIWLALSDMPVAFAPAASTGMVRSRRMIYFAGAGVLAGGVLWSWPLMQETGKALDLSSYYSVIMIIASACAATYATRRLSRHTPLVYAILGSALAVTMLIRHGEGIEKLYRLPIAWIIAPLTAGVVAAGLLSLYRRATAKSEIHLLKLSYHLRWGMICGVVLLSLAVGMNNGALFMSLFSGINSDFSLTLDTLYINEQQVLWAAMVIIVILAVGPRAVRRMEALADRDFDINTPSSLAVVLASAITLVVFSLPKVCGAFMLAASPLAVPHLILGATAGTSVVQQRQGTDFQGLMQAFISLFITPLLSFGIAYALFSITAGDLAVRAVNDAGTMGEQRFDLTFPLLILLLAVTAGAVIALMRNQQKAKLEARSQALQQQQQLFEKQRNLTELEIKQVLIENENLTHNLEMRRKELINIALNIDEQKDFLENLHSLLKQARGSRDAAQRESLIAEAEGMVMQRMNFSQETESLYAQVETMHKDFVLRLGEKYPRLTSQERKLTTLLRLGFSTKYIATLMNISPKSVDMGRYRLRSKFGLNRCQKLGEFIKSI